MWQVLQIPPAALSVHGVQQGSTTLARVRQSNKLKALSIDESQMTYFALTVYYILFKSISIDVLGVALVLPWLCRLHREVVESKKDARTKPACFPQAVKLRRSE